MSQKVYVPVKPELLRWAIQRSRIDHNALLAEFPDLAAWERGVELPTLAQLEDFARATHTPIGYLLLDQAPDERLDVADCRNRKIDRRPSTELLDTLYLMEQRHYYYAEFAELRGSVPRFGSASAYTTPVVEAACMLRDILDYDPEFFGSSRAVFEHIVDVAEQAGVLVMLGSRVGDRPLDPSEFRSIVLAHQVAPLVFINTNDERDNWLFTLAHGFAHVLLGHSCVDSPDVTAAGDYTTPDTGDADLDQIEEWCDNVALNFLLMDDEVIDTVREIEPDQTGHVALLQQHMPVPHLVAARRAHDLGFIDFDEFCVEMEIHEAEHAPVERVSRAFTTALLEHTLEGTTSYREAMRLLSLRSVDDLHRLADELSVRR